MRCKIRTDRSYTMHFKTNQYKNGVSITIERKADLELGVYTSFDDILRFESDVKKILNAVKKAYRNGDYIEVDLCVANYQTDYHDDGGFDNKQLTFDRWYYEGLQDNEDGLHLNADERYTEPSHDLWLDYKERILESLRSI